MHLSFSSHRHDFNSLERSACGFTRKEAETRLDQAFDEPMIVFNQSVELFHLPQFNPLGEHFGCFEFGHRFRIGCIFSNSDDTRGWLGSAGRHACSLMH
jgi:hypothetical protein